MLNFSLLSIASMSAKQMDEAENLRQLLARCGVKNKSKFAADVGFPGGPSMISQHLSGHRPISMDAAIAYAVHLGVSLDEVSPTVAEEVRAAAGLLRTDAVADGGGVYRIEREKALAEWPLRDISRDTFSKLAEWERLHIQSAVGMAWAHILQARAKGGEQQTPVAA
jgi:hypothetical protein